MTAQSPDILINEHPIELGCLKPYFINSPDDTSGMRYGCFPVPPSFPDNIGICSGLWRGYVATLRLCADGRLELVSYEFPYAHDKPAFQPVNQFFTGNFVITFRKTFFGPNTRVPVRDGVIIADQEQWEIEDETMSGVVTHVLRSTETNEPHGLYVTRFKRVFSPASEIPLSCIPDNFCGDLDALVGRSVDVTLELRENPRGPFDFILKPIRFGDYDDIDVNE